MKNQPAFLAAFAALAVATPLAAQTSFDDDTVRNRGFTIRAGVDFGR